jgi:hypothetical protein
MTKVFIKKSEFGFQYQIEGGRGFNYFHDGIDSREAIIRYFQERHDDTIIVWVNKAGEQAKIYTIKPGEKLAGQRIATVDYDKKFVFDDITTDLEKLEFLKFHLPEDPEVERLESEKDKVTGYLQNADEGTKTALKQMIADKLTPEVMRQQCEKNAEGYGLPAEIEFENGTT